MPMLEKKKNAFKWSLTQTGKTRYSKNMNIVVFTCIYFAVTSIKRKTLSK